LFLRIEEKKRRNFIFYLIKDIVNRL